MTATKRATKKPAPVVPTDVTIAFKTETLTKIIKTAAPAASDGVSRPILTGVHIVKKAGQPGLTIHATDFYRLVRIQLDQSAVFQSLDADEFDVIIPAGWLLRWARASRRDTPFATLTINAERTTATLSDYASVAMTEATEATTRRLVKGAYPAADELIDKEGGRQGSDDVKVAFNPRYFALLVKAATTWNPDAPLQFHIVNSLSPTCTTVLDRSGRLDLMLMPVRVP